MLAGLAPSWITLLIAIPTLAIAYAIFGIAGFGTALIAAPVLAQIMPVATIVPLLALLDCLAAIVNGVTLSEKIAKREMMWLVPLMIAGSLIGAWLLLIVPPQPMMLALGIFVVGFAVYAFVSPPPERTDRAFHLHPRRHLCACRNLQRSSHSAAGRVADSSDADRPLCRPSHHAAHVARAIPASAEPGADRDRNDADRSGAGGAMTY